MKDPTPHPLETLTAALAPIEPTDTISAAGRKIIMADAIRVMALEDGVRTSDDPEFIHDMRVATRRMRSALRLLGQYYRTKKVRQLNRSLRWLAALLGEVRDLDVLIEDFRKRDAAGLEQPIATAQQTRDSAHKKLLAALEGPEFAKLAKRLTAFALDSEDLLAGSAPLPFEVRHLAPVLLNQQLAAVRGFDVLFENGAHPDYKTLHLLRIAFKRLRYATTNFIDVLGGNAEEFVTEMKAVQDHLGRLNDVVVFAGHLSDHAQQTPEDETLIAALDALNREAAALAKSFLPVWHKFNSRAVQRHLADALLVLR